jgi:hypothetical protein
MDLKDLFFPIPEFSDDYVINCKGEVRNKHGTKMKVSTVGYPQVQCNRKCRMVHVILAQLFIPNDDPKTKTQVNHKNGNKADYSLGNLEWVTPSENIRHSHAQGNYKKRKQRDFDHSDEKWMAVAHPTFSHLYEASKDGHIRSSKTHQIISQCQNNEGYMRVTLSNKNFHQTLLVHRLIASTFCKKLSDEQMQVNHKNKIRNDNRVENLEWITRSNNVIHAKGNTVQLTSSNGTVKEFASPIVAARYLIGEGITNAKDKSISDNIQACIRKGTFKYLGFTWKYT